MRSWCVEHGLSFPWIKHRVKELQFVTLELSHNSFLSFIEKGSVKGTHIFVITSPPVAEILLADREQIRQCVRHIFWVVCACLEFN